MTKIVALFLILLVCSGAYFIFSTNSEDGMSRDCARLIGVINDSDKSQYLTRVALSIKNNHKLLKLIGPTGRLSLLERPELKEELGIDWSYVGMRSDVGGIYLNGLINNGSEEGSFSSVSIFQGRNQVIIKVSEIEGLGLNWPAYELEKIIRIKDEVYFFCGF